jgi:hypothetical protein
MKALKSARTLAASLGVLAGVALAATPAMAFDDVDWDWKKDVKEYVDIDAYIDLKVDITGMVQVEKLQIFLGDVKAESYVHDIDNNPFYEKTGYWDPDYAVPEDKKKHGYGGKGGDFEINIGAICYALCIGVVVDDWDKHGKRRHKDDGWDKIPVKPLDARVELPIVLSAATAVGNNQSITSDVPIFLHDGQYLANVKSGNTYPTPTPVSYDTQDAWKKPPICVYGFGKDCDKPNHDYGGNAFVDLAEDFLKDAKYHKLTHANISAYSKVWDIKNASVDSSATAVGNNISVTLASDVDGCNDTCNQGRFSNHIVIADITQFALANVHAKSEVYDVSATGYNHMRELTTETLSEREGDPGFTIKVPTPWISSVATAVGNNVSISVGRDLTPTAKTTSP